VEQVCRADKRRAQADAFHSRRDARGCRQVGARYQAQIYQKKAVALGNLVKLDVHPGKDHGWTGIEKDMENIADWFDEHLKGIKKAKA
jgi:S-formylglutathione hydrolase FrmB